jgi:sensor domain CHASE-containing protein
MLNRLRNFYAQLFTTIRAKLIAIISLIILVSILLFTGISLNLFQTNMSRADQAEQRQQCEDALRQN